MSRNDDGYTLAIIGGGSAAEELVRRLDGSDERIVVFEPALVGGECPFLACMPSKSMLYDRTAGRSWGQAVERRRSVTSGLDDSGHVDALHRHGATLVRERATIDAPGCVEANGTTYHVDHIVIATGASPVVPPIEGLDPDHPRVWTSDDAMTATERPDRLVVIGGGVVGSELALMFAGFGTEVTTLDRSERPLDDLHPCVGEILGEVLTESGVQLVAGVEPTLVELDDDGVRVHDDRGRVHAGDVVLVATGRRAAVDGIGLDRLGVDSDAAEVDEVGRLVGAESVWLAGDAAGGAQYTHVANHHARVIADHLVGGATRRIDDVVVPACVFTDPPVMVVGPTWAELGDDEDVVWTGVEVDTARSLTDEHRSGFLAIAARRSTRCLVAAHGIGARFDELATALVVAIDGGVPVDRLAESMQPFPTMGEILGVAFRELCAALDEAPTGPGHA